MSSIQDINRLKKYVSKFLKNWLDNQGNERRMLHQPTSSLEGYLNNIEDCESIFLGLETQWLSTWYLMNYEDSVINKEKPDYQYLSLATAYSYARIIFESTCVNNINKGDISLKGAAQILSLAVICGWKKTANHIFEIILHGLDTQLLDLRHNDRHCAGEVYRHFWFVLQLYGKSIGREIDTSKYSYPKDMSPYIEVLTDWKTANLNKVEDLVAKMADFHIEETKNNQAHEVDEFDDEDFMLFPYEILLWLRLREWDGLKNPEQFTHPLMQISLAKLPPTLAVPDTPLLNKVLEKFKKEYPRSF